MLLLANSNNLFFRLITNKICELASS